MTAFIDKYEKNVAGQFFVDTDCIACDTCTDIARDHFTLNDTFDQAYVIAQPTTAEATALCEKALEACPVDSIGKAF